MMMMVCVCVHVYMCYSMCVAVSSLLYVSPADCTRGIWCTPHYLQGVLVI